MKNQQMSIVLSNIIPLIGVFFLGWDAYSVFGIYIIETIIVGLLHAIKMYIINKRGISSVDENDKNNSLTKNMGCFIPFFLFHFMFFVFVQTILVFSTRSVGNHGFLNGFKYLNSLLNGDTGIAIASFTLFSLMLLVNDLVNAADKYKSISMEKIMMEPYPRIIIQQIVVIFGSFLVMITRSGTPLVILFVIVKILAEYILLYWNHPMVKRFIKSNE